MEGFFKGAVYATMNVALRSHCAMFPTHRPTVQLCLG